MIGFGSATRVYLAAGATDMRKGFDGLFGIARDRLGMDPLSGHLFVYCNGRRNRLKVLYWDGSGLQADETPVGVQMHDGRGKNHQAYLWQYSRPGGVVIFDF
jgi:IS66 Orf2 like protein